MDVSKAEDNLIYEWLRDLKEKQTKKEARCKANFKYYDAEFLKFC